jgi:hypothetical protein
VTIVLEVIVAYIALILIMIGIAYCLQFDGHSRFSVTLSNYKRGPERCPEAYNALFSYLALPVWSRIKRDAEFQKWCSDNEIYIYYDRDRLPVIMEKVHGRG